jgi:nucleotide-binding universal stress UspA family protein
MGALSNQLYTMIVAMAVVTTMIMPPTLRWMMARVPLREEEAKRLDKEEAEENQAVPKMERALVLADDSANGQWATTLAGLFAGRQKVLTTLLESPRNGQSTGTPAARERLVDSIRLALHDGQPAQSPEKAATPKMPAEQFVQVRALTTEDGIEKEATKGYSIAFVGIDAPISPQAARFEDQLQRLVASFDGPMAIVVNGNRSHSAVGRPLDILVPTGGSPEARLATEIALAVAGGSKGELTALHVFDPNDDAMLLRGRARRLGLSLLVDARRLGRRTGVPVKGVTETNSQPETEIRRAARRGRHDLVVLGTSLRTGNAKFLSARSLALIEALRCPVLLIAR